MKLNTIVLIASIFTSSASQAIASPCGQICTKEFWTKASQEEIDAAIAEVDVKSLPTGDTALMWVARYGTNRDIAALVEMGANPNGRASGSETALMWAAGYGTALNVKALLDLGADVDARTLRGMTPLHFAASSGTAENIAALIAAKAELEAISAVGTTPLHSAAAFGSPDNVLELLNAGAAGDVRGADGATAWDLAQHNDKLKGTDAFWKLNDARFK